MLSEYQKYSNCPTVRKRRLNYAYDLLFRTVSKMYLFHISCSNSISSNRFSIFSISGEKRCEMNILLKFSHMYISTRPNPELFRQSPDIFLLGQNLHWAIWTGGNAVAYLFTYGFLLPTEVFSTILLERSIIECGEELMSFNY